MTNQPVPISVNFLCWILGHKPARPGQHQCPRCGMPTLYTLLETRTLRAYLADWLRWQRHKRAKP